MSAVNTDMEVAEDATAALAVGELSASDPAIYEQIVQPWELCNTPLARGDFGYRIRYLQTPVIIDHTPTQRGGRHQPEKPGIRLSQGIRTDTDGIYTIATFPCRASTIDGCLSPADDRGAGCLRQWLLSSGTILGGLSTAVR